MNKQTEIISDIVKGGSSEAEAGERQGSVEQIAADSPAESAQRKMKAKDWRGICLIVVSALLLISCIIQILLQIQFGLQMSSAIGIIGGADGPTSIFVAGNIGTPWGLYVSAAVVLIATIFYFMKKRK